VGRNASCAGLILEHRDPWDEPVTLALRVLDRIGRPEDIAYAALYLASDEPGWLTGHALGIDGGDDVLFRAESRTGIRPGY
jgi:NAD(P)-dependent dehydrogenase (short-subunit alcohol dehydrogenase family)